MFKSSSDSQFGTSMASSQIGNQSESSLVSQPVSKSFLKQKPVDTSNFGKSLNMPS